MLAKTGTAFDNENYLFEPKWDGLRAILFFQQGKIELQNRNLREATASYPELQKINSGVRAESAIIDGEIVVLRDDGLPDFGRLQARFGVEGRQRIEVLSKTTPVIYVAFDLLHLDGKDMIFLPLIERKKKLRFVLREGSYLLYGDHIESEGIRFFNEATSRGFEGVIAKEESARYVPGLRTDRWIKTKKVNTADCIVVGWSKGEGARSSTFGSLILAAYDDNGQLKHVGNVGGGFSDKILEFLKEKLSKIDAKTATVNEPVDSPTPVTWVKPRLVVEVDYMSITTDGRLRFPRFKRLRTDKDPRDCGIPSR
ncbi:MAG TPA: non-homologous end-joining DNA ligase [Candidatus Bathyarchaeia archaeon]|nr:non-homologous end-joining DNA ligase [Candidatus Bathyarchaeia archaeon]